MHRFITITMESTANNNYRRRERQPQAPAQDALGRLAPRDTEVEAAVLGALMIEKDAYVAVCDLLKPESFYEPAHSKVYEAIQTLGAAQRPIDMLTVTEQLRLNGTFDEVGGMAFIVNLTSNVTSAAHLSLIHISEPTRP